MYRCDSLPEVTLKWAQTLDGQLADDNNQSQWISGLEERRYTHQLRSNHQAILVGAQTFLKDQCQLTVRDIGYDGPQPARIIIDPRGRIAQALRQHPHLIIDLHSGPRRTYLLTDILEDTEDIENMFDPEKLIRINYRFNDFNQWLKGSLRQLSRTFEITEHRRLLHLMVEGGPATLSEFLKAGLAHRLEIAISPLILGGQRHRVYTDFLLHNVDRFEIESKEQLGVDILLRYRIPPATPTKQAATI
ncbi:MAG: RibD family protein [Bdellovibrionaceae bacterium]|nr:RibD family protein [Pseudobdellovibrionaceae bacterium]